MGDVQNYGQETSGPTEALQREGGGPWPCSFIQNLLYFCKQPFQIAGVIPILRDEEQSEEGEHPDQAPTASKLQSQDQFPDLGNSFLFPGPLSLEEGITENMH